MRRRYTRLAEEDVEILVANTDFSEAEVREWWREFLMDCPEGVLTRDKVWSYPVWQLNYLAGSIVYCVYRCMLMSQ